ncbi:mechanosensitive ion channel family protein [Marinagarivorans cellulosilyticus]|uniref:Small-conductance mechanosensitive channel n=1 Tax=Marinagarivorans cellulosilyticus TaxID=2721545 RepID=A0AAN1WEA1_9GAMM|nr:mechanosensitive ion channel domain-containing protein [Marinagarivorans cellulosilyticus]BCD95982.1 small conductance mechanosensitive channel [Marinagarivorans cellulosilyticus]
MNENIEELLQRAPEIIVTYGVKILLAFAVYLIGKWIAKGIAGLLEKGMKSRNVDATIISFTKNIVYYAMFTMVIIAALGQLGVQTASFVAIIGAAGLAIGFALQGSLANFAAGVLLILFRPFKLGDFVEAGGASGVVKEVSIFSTILTTGDNKTVTISNASVMGGNITNYSTQPERRVDFTVGVSYGADLDLVRKELTAIAKGDDRIIVDKGITIGLAELADSSVNFAFRIWTKTENYWPLYFDTNEKIKKRFDAAGIEIPFPQMDVHVAKEA